MNAWQRLKKWAIRDTSIPDTQSASMTPLDAVKRGIDYPAPHELVGLVLPSSTGVSVLRETVLSLTPAFAAIRYICEGVAMLDRRIKEEKSGQVKITNEHRLSAFFNSRPHPHYTWFDFISTLVANACLGNGYALIHRGKYNDPIALELIPSSMVRQEYSDDGSLVYDIYIDRGVEVLQRRVLSSDMIHLKGLSTNGLSGKEVHVTHRTTIASCVASKRYTEGVFSNQARPSIVVKSQDAMELDEVVAIENNISSRMAGPTRAGRPLVLDNGMDVQYLQWSPADVMVVDFEKLSIEDCSRIFKMPPDIISASVQTGTYSAIKYRTRSFLTHTLGPWLEKIQEEFNSKLFHSSEFQKRSAYFEFDTSLYVSLEPEQQAKYYQVLVSASIMTPNEVREQLSLPPMEGGDQLYGDINTLPLNHLVEVALAKYLSSKGETARDERLKNDTETNNSTPDDETGLDDEF